MFLLVVDAHSKWPEVIDMGSNTKAPKLISVMKGIFCMVYRSMQSLIMVLNCADFTDFFKRNGIKISFSPPYHPATENFVKTFKDKVDKIMADGKSLE